MKRHYVACWLQLIILLLLSSSCANANESLNTPSSTVSASPANSVTHRPSITPLSTVLPSLTPTPTMMPTLPIEDAQATLLKLLTDNGGCRLPCLWGIVPGVSTYQEAQATLSSLSSISKLTSFKPETGAIFPVYTEDDLEIFTTVGFIVNPDNHMTNHIAFKAEAHRPLKEGGYQDVFDSNFFGVKTGAYTLSHVLTEQGLPSSAMISTYGGPLTRGGTGGFDILLLYPSQGILINYTTQMYVTGPTVRGCHLNAHVEMELYPQGNSESFFELLKQTDWVVKFSYYQPLEQVTSMSVQKFYETFRQSTDECIETPAKLWPTQEP